MKFKHTPIQDDGGGNLTVIAETKPEIMEVIKHFRVIDTDTPEGCIKLAEALHGETFTYESKPKKRFWYAVESALDFDSTKPYTDLLQKITGFGYDGAMLPDLDFTSQHPRRLCHTHITDYLRLEQGHICFLAYDNAEDWDGRKAADRAVINATDYIVEDFGFRRYEREYIEACTGHIVCNPNYTKRHNAQPGLGSEWLWQAIFEWWRDNKASEQQKQLLERNKELKGNGVLGLDADWKIRKGASDQAGLVSYNGLYVKSDKGHEWDGKGIKFEVVPWDEFAKLGMSDKPAIA